MKLRILLIVVLAWCSTAAVAEAQRGIGELRLQVRDATGGAVQASGSLESQATHVRQTFVPKGIAHPVVLNPILILSKNTIRFMVNIFGSVLT